MWSHCHRASFASLALRRRLMCMLVSPPPPPPSSLSHTPVKGLPLYKRLSALGSRAGKGSVKLTMNKWLREGRSVKAKDIVNYIKRLRKYGRYGHALELMEWMESRGMNMSYSNYALRMHLISKVAGVESAEKYFNYLPEPAKNHLTYGALMNIYCAEKMIDKATSLFEKMKDLGYSTDTLVYNSLMSLFVKTSHLDKVLPLLEDMKQKKIRMDSFTYSTLITYYSTLGDIEAVDRTMQQMDEGHQSCQRWPAYSNLTSVYISTGYIEKAKFSLKRLEETMDLKDRDAYHHLISLYARLGNLAEVKRVWFSLKASLKATNKSYLIFLQALRMLDDFDALEECFYEWDSNCETYDMWLVNIMIDAYLQRTKVDKARSLLECAIAKGGEPDWRTSKLFIEYHVRNQEFELALECFNSAAAKLQTLKCDNLMADSILQYLKKQNDMARVTAFCRQLKELQCPTSADATLEDLEEPEAM